MVYLNLTKLGFFNINFHIMFYVFQMCFDVTYKLFTTDWDFSCDFISRLIFHNFISEFTISHVTTFHVRCFYM